MNPSLPDSYPRIPNVSSSRTEPDTNSDISLCLNLDLDPIHGSVGMIPRPSRCHSVDLRIRNGTLIVPSSEIDPAVEGKEQAAGVGFTLEGLLSA